MSGILDLLSSPIGKTIISGVTESTGQDKNKTESVMTMAFPVLMNAMQHNASNSQGAGRKRRFRRALLKEIILQSYKY
jgi:hypothetical protein